MPIKAILFDLDNTIVDFMKMKRKSCEAAVEAMISSGLKMKREDALQNLYALYDRYGIEYQKIFEKFTKEVTGKIDYRIISYGILAYRKMKDSYLVPYANAVPTLIELKKQGYKLAIVSDAPVLEAWMRLVSMKIDSLFDKVITKADVRKQKTHAAPFKATLNALNISPNEAIMIGDRIPRDVNTAKKLGIYTVYARYGDENPAEKTKSGADFEIEDISEILDILKEIR